MFKDNISDLIQENIQLKKDVEYLKNEQTSKKVKQSKEKWKVGSQCIHTESLTLGSKGDPNYVEFDATYTSEIIELSEFKLKVKPIDVNVTKSAVLNNNGKQELLTFYENKWVNKTSADLIMDEAYYRKTTIDNILDE